MFYGKMKNVERIKYANVSDRRGTVVVEATSCRFDKRLR